MPTELVKECLGKECVLTLMTDKGEFVGIVKEIEGYWIKIQEKDSIRIINGVAIRDIKIVSK